MSKRKPRKEKLSAAVEYDIRKMPWRDRLADALATEAERVRLRTAIRRNLLDNSSPQDINVMAAEAELERAKAERERAAAPRPLRPDQMQLLDDAIEVLRKSYSKGKPSQREVARKLRQDEHCRHRYRHVSVDALKLRMSRALDALVRLERDELRKADDVKGPRTPPAPAERGGLFFLAPNTLAEK